MHSEGNHSLCRANRPCRSLKIVGDDPGEHVPDDVAALVEQVDREFDDDDLMVKFLARRLARLTGTNGPAGVSAARALGELVAANREKGH